LCAQSRSFSVDFFSLFALDEKEKQQQMEMCTHFKIEQRNLLQGVEDIRSVKERNETENFAWVVGCTHLPIRLGVFGSHEKWTEVGIGGFCMQVFLVWFALVREKEKEKREKGL
jgi:hypothetical protein